MPDSLPKDLVTSTNMDMSAFNSKSIGGKKKTMRKVASSYKKKIDDIKKWLKTVSDKKTDTYKRGGKSTTRPMRRTGKRTQTMKRRK